MRIIGKKIIPVLLGIMAATSVSAQESEDEDKNKLSLDELPKYDVPRDLFMPEAKGFAKLRAFTLDHWTRIRLTNHPLYHYVLSAAKFRAYFTYCKRNDLNVDMGPINKLSLMNLIEIVSAQYEEPEWANFVGLSDDQTRQYLADVSHDVYAFEFAAALSVQNEDRVKMEATTQQYCLLVEKKNFDEYIGLLATAKRQLPADKQ